MPSSAWLGEEGTNAAPSQISQAEIANAVVQIGVDQIRPNPRQPRTRFSIEEIDELAASIREHGIIQPLS